MEYKIIEGSPAECQKLLNQWRHKHDIVIKAQFSNNINQNREINAKPM